MDPAGVRVLGRGNGGVTDGLGSRVVTDHPDGHGSHTTLSASSENPCVSVSSVTCLIGVVRDLSVFGDSAPICAFRDDDMLGCRAHALRKEMPR